MQKVVTNLWFDTEAEEAAKFYTSIFKNSGIKETLYYGEGGMRPKDMVMTVTFEIEGQEFTGINGGPQFKFTEAVSLLVNCENQQEIDELWEKLSEGGEEGPCGWLKDRYGLSWQLSPLILNDFLKDPDPNKSQRVMEALLKMDGKIDIEALKQAYTGKNNV